MPAFALAVGRPSADPFPIPVRTHVMPMPTHYIVVTSPDGVHYAGPVMEPAPDRMRQDFHPYPVEVPMEDAHYAFDWAMDTAWEWVEHAGVESQVWHIVDGIVTEYSHARQFIRERHCYWCNYVIVMARVRNDGVDEWEHVAKDAGWSVHVAKP